MRKVVAVLAGGALSACASGDPPLAAEYGRIDRPGVVLDNPAPAPTTPSPAEPAEVTLAFAGDVHFEDDVRERLADPATTLDTVSDVLSAADVTVVNLETAVTERGVAQPKTYTFRVGPDAFDALAAAADAPLAGIGIGADDDAAFAPAMFEIGGTAVAVIGATDVPDHTAAWDELRACTGLESGVEMG